MQIDALKIIFHENNVIGFKIYKRTYIQFIKQMENGVSVPGGSYRLV